MTFFLCQPADVTANGGDCHTGGTKVGAVQTLDGTGHATSDSTTNTLTIGTYCWRAEYGGDGFYLPSTEGTSSHECFTTVKQPSTTSTLSAPTGGGAALGSSPTDTATVAGAAGQPTPTGTVDFFLCQPADVNATGCPAGKGTKVGATKTLVAGVATSDPAAAVTTVGKYCWRSEYSGDGFYLPSTHTDASSECFTTVKSTPVLTTTASGPVTVGATITDTAHLSGGFPFLSGTITFDVFAPGDTNCATPLVPAPAQAMVLLGAGDYQSGPFTTAQAGTYRWIAHYSGDANNNPVDTACNDANEASTVNKTTPSIATTLSASEVVVGTAVHDSAKLSSATPDAGGTVTYTVYSNNTCTTGAQAAGTVNVTKGAVPDSNAITFNTAGDFYWQAAYSGDANNGVATSPCTSEHLLVDKPALAITKSPATQAVDSGGTATFTIVVTNTGTVTLTNVTVTDPLSTGCSKSIGTLTPAQSVSYTCTQSNVTAAYTNVATATGHPPVGPDVTASASAGVTINPPPPPGPAPTPTPTPTVDLQIVKTANPASLLVGNNTTYTLTVKNNGPVTDTGVQVADSLPAGVTYVSSSSTQGSCTGSSVVQCAIGTMANGQVVTVTIVVKTANTGTIANTATVVGDLPETTLTNNTSSASIQVTAPPAAVVKTKPTPKPFKPPVAKPKPKPKPKPVVKPKPVPPPCLATAVAPKNLTVGSATKLVLRVTAKNKPLGGVKVLISGPGILKMSDPTDPAGRVVVNLHPKKAGILLVKPSLHKGCNAPHIGVIAAFTPPVTG